MGREGQPQHFRRLVLFLPAALAVLASGALTVWVVRLLLREMAQSAQFEFERAAEESAALIEGAVVDRLVVLHSIQSMYTVAERSPRPEFRALVEPLQSGSDGVRAIEWVPRVSHQDRLQFEAARQSEGYVGFRIKERLADGGMSAAADRDEYYPVFPLGADDPTDPSVGFDLGSSTSRRVALEKARDAGTLLASGRVRLVREVEESVFGFLVFAPVYSLDAPRSTRDERRSALRGFVIGVFRLPDLVETALSAQYEQLPLTLYDDEAEVDERFLYRRLPVEEATDWPLGLALREHRSSFEIAGRRWSVVASPTLAFVQRHDVLMPFGLLAAGLALSLVIGLYSAVIAHQKEQLRRVATALAGANEELQLINRVQRLGNEAEDLPTLLRNSARVTVDALGLETGKIELVDGSDDELSTESGMESREIARPGPERTLPILFGGRRLGSLWLKQRSVEAPSEHVLSRAQLVCDQLGAIIARVQAEEQNRRDLEEKKVLLKEVHHRVKNNLQLVSSLQSLQASDAQDQHLRDSYRQNERRIKSIALVHEQLYQTEDLSHIELSRYTQDLVDHIRAASGGDSSRPEVVCEMDAVHVSVGTAIPFGLIVNELVLNAIQHAFPESSAGTLAIRLGAQQGEIELCVSDNGVGLAAEKSPNGTSLGLTLVRTLAGQLGGSLEVVSRPDFPGTSVTLRFAP